WLTTQSGANWSLQEIRGKQAKYREIPRIFGIEEPFSLHFLGTKQCLTPQIPYSTEQGIISVDQGTIVTQQGSDRLLQRITCALLSLSD
ncbi:MAG: hypothetical protein WA813_19170, partial [Beijerinckiaceae bacterium]